VAPVDVMMESGFLTRDRFEDWRFGWVPYLERVIACNRSKVQRVPAIAKNHAEERGLKQSLTVSKKWARAGKGCREAATMTIGDGFRPPPPA
jgi:hypothetical protein